MLAGGERAPVHVREDVIDGYVSRQGAACDYGVVIRDDLSLDEAATAKHRAPLQTETVD